MQDLLLRPLSELDPSATALARLRCELADSRAQVVDLRAELERLRREHLELRQPAGYWRALHAAAKKRSDDFEHEVTLLRGENRKLQDLHFGRKSEKASARDRSNTLEGELEIPFSSEPARRGQRKERPGPKRRDSTHLPVVDGLSVLPEHERGCPECGKPFSPRNT